jgi:hypothetical protein
LTNFKFAVFRASVPPLVRTALTVQQSYMHDCQCQSTATVYSSERSQLVVECWHLDLNGTPSLFSSGRNRTRNWHSGSRSVVVICDRKVVIVVHFTPPGTIHQSVCSSRSLMCPPLPGLPGRLIKPNERPDFWRAHMLADGLGSTNSPIVNIHFTVPISFCDPVIFGGTFDFLPHLPARLKTCGWCCLIRAS